MAAAWLVPALSAVALPSTESAASRPQPGAKRSTVSSRAVNEHGALARSAAPTATTLVEFAGQVLAGPLFPAAATTAIPWSCARETSSEKRPASSADGGGSPPEG